MALTQEQAKAIYKARYWDAIRGDELPSGVDYAVFDFGVNSGVSRAVKYLQRIVGVYVDGVIGNATISAVAKADASAVAATLCDQRLAFLKSLPTWAAFGNGWGRRVASVRSASVAMAGAGPKPAPVEPQAPKSKHVAAGSSAAATGAALHVLGLPVWACVSLAIAVAVAVYLIMKNRK
jgi:lysozyme family protein